jgi:adenosylcobinamide-GDP ribazoletransferase
LQQRRSLLCYPLVGLLIGVLLMGVHYGLVEVLHTASALLQAAVLLAVWVAITGGLHLDGLADSADAWLGGLGDRARTLAIMKDPCAGPAGVVALVLVLLLKLAALAALVTANGPWPLLLVAPVLGRAAVVALLVSTPYVRAGGIGENLAAQDGRFWPWFVIGLAIVLAVWLAGERGLWVVAIGGLVAWWQRRRMLARIGGTTGDTAGALLEIVETTALLVLAL